MEHKTFIEQVLREASMLARQYFGTVMSTTKAGDNNQVLTEADLAIGALLVDAVQQAYPEHNIIDEEAGVIDKQSKFTWVIDPVDGTSNFASGSPLYGSMIGLLEGAVPVAGGIALPNFNELYVAQKGQGAFCNGAQIRGTSETKILDCLVAYGIDGHQEDPRQTRGEAALLAEIILGSRNLRSSNSAFDAAQVAKGVYGACLNRTSKIWDNVAQQVILEEAGVLYTDFFGKPIDYSDPLSKVSQNFTYCAAPPMLHAELQAIIQA